MVKNVRFRSTNLKDTRDYVVNLDPESLGNPIEEFTLRPGDFLYFPRGTIHQACADEGNQFSTHITISTYQHQSYGDYLRSVLFSSVEGLASSSVDFRRGIPLGSISNPVFNSSPLWNEMTSQLGKLTEQLSSHLRKIPFPQPMILDFWSSRLPPFGIDLDEIEGSQPKSPMPDMEDEVRLLYKTHVYFMKQKFQPDERDSEDEEKEEEQVEAIGFYSSIFNSRSDHMIMVEDHSSIENEPRVVLKFPLTYEESMKLLFERESVAANELPLPREDAEKLLSSLWSCHLLETVKT